jgi:hypothetical protein
MLQATVYFLVLAQQVFFVLQYLWPLTLLLACGWVWVFAAADQRLAGGRRRLFWLGCAPPFVISFLILACGVAFAHHPGSDQPAPAYPEYLIWVLLLAHLPLAGLLAWRWGGQWPAVAMSSLAAGYVSMCAGFISTMSVTGVWL